MSRLALLLVLFILRQQAGIAPMLDLRLFASVPFATANVVGFLSSFAMFGSIFFITLFVQGVWGWKPLAAGLGTMPWTGTIMVTAPLAGALAGRIGARRAFILGGVFGIAVLGAIFQGIVRVPSQFIDGFHVTLRVAAGFLILGTAASLLLPGRGALGGRAERAEPGTPTSVPQPVVIVEELQDSLTR